MANRSMRTVALTDKGMQAIADMPPRTWDDVLKTSKVGSCNPYGVEPRPPKG